MDLDMHGYIRDFEQEGGGVGLCIDYPPEVTIEE